MKILQLLTLCFCLFLGTSVIAQNKSVPSIELKALDGSTVDLKDHITEGKITVISFWATWCSPCKKELDNLMDFYPEWQSDNVEIIAISMDDARTSSKVKSTVDAKGWEYKILLDPNQNSYKKLNFQTVPQSFIVDQEGNIVYAHSGYKDGDEYDMEEKIMELIEE